MDMCSKSKLLNNSRIVINKTLTILEINEFKKLILTLVSVRRKLGLDFNPILLTNFYHRCLLIMKDYF